MKKELGWKILREVSLMMLRISITLAGIILLQSCVAARAKANESETAQPQMTANEAAEYYKNNAFMIPINPWGDDFSYVVYGRLLMPNRLTGSEHGVVTLDPMLEGGIDYVEYGMRTCFVPSDVLEAIGGEHYVDETGKEIWRTQDRVFKIEMTGCADGGGLTSLPAIILRIEEISVGDIPPWGGM